MNVRVLTIFPSDGKTSIRRRTLFSSRLAKYEAEGWLPCMPILYTLLFVQRLTSRTGGLALYWMRARTQGRRQLAGHTQVFHIDNLARRIASHSALRHRSPVLIGKVQKIVGLLGYTADSFIRRRREVLLERQLNSSRSPAYLACVGRLFARRL